MYSFQLTCGGTIQSYRECPATQNGINECIWEGSDFNLRDEWVVTFTATNKLKEEGVKYEHKVNTYSVGKYFSNKNF